MLVETMYGANVHLELERSSLARVLYCAKSFSISMGAPVESFFYKLVVFNVTFCTVLFCEVEPCEKREEITTNHIKWVFKL